MERFREVTPNILRGGEPTPKEVQVLKDVWNVKRIISLDLEAAKNIQKICNKLDIEHIVLPIEMTQEFSSVVKFLSENIVELLTTKTPVYIHCVHGRDRTGLAITLYRIKGENKSVEEALTEARSLDFGEGLSSERLDFFLSIIDDAGTKRDLSNADDKRKRRRIRRRKIFQDLNDAMAYVGVNDGVNPILKYVNPIDQGIPPYGTPISVSPYGSYYL